MCKTNSHHQRMEEFFNNYQHITNALECLGISASINIEHLAISRFQYFQNTYPAGPLWS